LLIVPILCPSTLKGSTAMIRYAGIDPATQPGSLLTKVAKPGGAKRATTVAERLTFAEAL
jgi:hypothetical protein